MLSQRQVEARAAFEHGLRMRELAETPLAMIGAHTRMPRAVERYSLHHHVDTHLVDATAPKLLGAHDTVSPSHILGKQIHS